jgi:hypothetical protein
MQLLLDFFAMFENHDALNNDEEMEYGLPGQDQSTSSTSVTKEPKCHDNQNASRNIDQAENPTSIVSDYNKQPAETSSQENVTNAENDEQDCIPTPPSSIPCDDDKDPIPTPSLIGAQAVKVAASIVKCSFDQLCEFIYYTAQIIILTLN